MRNERETDLDIRPLLWMPAQIPARQPSGMRKQGVASALLEDLRRRADGSIFLEVAEGNIAARALYRRTGWEQVSTRKDYYGPGRNAIVMKKSSC